MDSRSSRRVGAFIVVEFAVVGVLALASVVKAPQPATSDDANPTSPPATESVTPGRSISTSPGASGSISSGAAAPRSTILLPTILLPTLPPARDPSPTILVPPPIR